MSVNRTAVVGRIAARTGLTKAQSDAALAALQDVLVESLAAGEQVKITGLFTVERAERAARPGRNPRTGEPMEIAARFVPKISAGSTLRNAARG